LLIRAVANERAVRTVTEWCRGCLKISQNLLAMLVTYMGTHFQIAPLVEQADVIRGRFRCWEFSFI